MGEGYGGIKEKERKRGSMTKGGRRNGEHEVGLDRTMGLQVTFELLFTTRPHYGIVWRDSEEESVFSPNE